MGRSFTTRRSKRWWNGKGFIIFRPAGTRKPVSWNGSIEPWNNVCTGTLRWRTPWISYRSCRTWCKGTIVRTIAVSRGPRTRWPKPIVPRCGRSFMERRKGQEWRDHGSRWEIVWDSTRSSGRSRKGIYPVGPKRCLWWNACRGVEYRPIKWTNGTGRPSKVPFTSRICRRWPWRTTTCSASTRSSNGKGIKSWSVGKGGQTSTTLGWVRKTSWPNHEWVSRPVAE